jgi:hypothetical protein
MKIPEVRLFWSLHQTARHLTGKVAAKVKRSQKKSELSKFLIFIEYEEDLCDK